MTKQRIKINAAGECFWFWTRIYHDVARSPATAELWIGPYATVAEAYGASLAYRRDGTALNRNGYAVEAPGWPVRTLSSECVYRPNEAARRAAETGGAVRFVDALARSSWSPDA